MSAKVHYIFSGRFQPFHIGHVAVINYLARRYDGPIVIGIINPDPMEPYPGDDPNWIRFAKDKNPLTYWERYSSINEWLGETRYVSKITGVVPLPRPSINLIRANCFLPPKPRLFVLCKRWMDEVEDWKAAKYLENGEEIVFVPVEDLDPISQLASGDLIRSLVALNNRGWEGLVPSSVTSYLKQQNLVQKLGRSLDPNVAKNYVLELLENEKFGGLIGELFEDFSLEAEQHNNQAQVARRTREDEILAVGLKFLSKIPELKGSQLGTLIYTEAIHMDTYNADQVGAMGPNAHAHDMTFNQIWNQIERSINLDDLAREISTLYTKMKSEVSEPHEEAACEAIATAEIAARKGDGPQVLHSLAKAGTWALNTAQEIGTTLAAEVIKKALGL